MMAVTVRIPTPFQYLTDGMEEVNVTPDNIIGLVRQLDHQYPGLLEKLVEDGKIRGYINILVNEDDIRYLKAEDTIVHDGDEVIIIPAIAGG
jgi:molybdopterin synthase sulfur carrier subunit